MTTTRDLIAMFTNRAPTFDQPMLRRRILRWNCTAKQINWFRDIAMRAGEWGTDDWAGQVEGWQRILSSDENGMVYALVHQSRNGSGWIEIVEREFDEDVKAMGREEDVETAILRAEAMC